METAPCEDRLTWNRIAPSLLRHDLPALGKPTLAILSARPAELTSLYVWLASPEASYVTGEVFGATGGQMPF